MGLLIIIMMAIGGLIAGIPCWILWWLTKRLPTWLRLLFVTFLFALSITPVGGGSEGGPWVAPLGIVLPFALFKLAIGDSSGGSEMHELISKEAAIFLLCIWGVTYLISIIVFGISYLVKKRKSKPVI